MANPRKVDVTEDRPAEEQEAVQNVDPQALKGPTASQQKAADVDGEYLLPQLLENSSNILGVPRFVLASAVASFGEEDKQAYKVSEARRLVEKFQNHEVNS